MPPFAQPPPDTVICAPGKPLNVLRVTYCEVVGPEGAGGVELAGGVVLAVVLEVVDPFLLGVCARVVKAAFEIVGLMMFKIKKANKRYLFIT